MSQNGILIITVPNGRMDTSFRHINFWSPESWEIFIKEHANKKYVLDIGLFNNYKNNYAIIKNVVNN